MIVLKDNLTRVMFVIKKGKMYIFIYIFMHVLTIFFGGHTQWGLCLGLCSGDTLGGA